MSGLPLRSVLVGMVLLVPLGVGAQETSARLPTFELERLELPTNPASLLIGGALLPPGDFRFSLVGHYQREPLTLVYGGQRLALVRDRATAQLAGVWSVASWLELGIRVPFVVEQRGDEPGAPGLGAPKSRGLSTPFASTRLGLLSQRGGAALDMALELGLGLPVGSAEAFARDEGPRLSARLQVGRRFGWLRPALEAEVLRRSSAAIGLPEDPRPLLGREVRLAAALALLGEGLRGEVGARATLPLEHSRNALEVLGGLHYPVLPELEVFALGGLGFGSAPGTPLYRAAAGLSFGSAPLPEPELHLPERVMPGQAPPRTPSPRRPAVSTSSMAPWPPDEAPPGEDTGEEDTGEDAPDERQPDARRTKP